MNENIVPTPQSCHAEWLLVLARAFDSLNYPTGIIDNNGTWLVANKAACEVLDITDCKAQDIGAIIRSRLQTIEETPLPEEAKGVKGLKRGDYFADVKTGRIYQRRVSPLNDDTGQSFGLVVSILDVTSLYEADERMRVMIDAAPLCCNFWNENHENIDCNLEAAKLFDLPNKQAYLDRFSELSPEKQPNGERSADAAEAHIKKAFSEGYDRFEWMHQKPNGEPIPAEITLVRVAHRTGNVVLGYTRDLRSSRTVTDVDDLDWLMRIFRSLPFPTGVASVSGRWIFLNHAAQEFFGIEDASDIPPGSSSDWNGRLKRLKPVSGEGYEGPGGGEQIYFSDEKTGSIYIRHSSPLHDNLGGLVGRIETLQDVTNQYDAEERVRTMIEAAPLCCNYWNEKFENIDCNQEAAKLFDLPNKQAYLDHFFELSPEKQPNGNLSKDEALIHITKAFKDGFERFQWMHQKLNGDPVPAEITLIRTKTRKGFVVLGYTRDLRH